MDGLSLKVEDAEIAYDDALAFREAIIRLTDNEPAVTCLLNELQDATLRAEKLWQEIEQTAEFRQRYQSRDDCRTDFLRNFYSKH